MTFPGVATTRTAIPASMSRSTTRVSIPTLSRPCKLRRVDSEGRVTNRKPSARSTGSANPGVALEWIDNLAAPSTTASRARDRRLGRTLKRWGPQLPPDTGQAPATGPWRRSATSSNASSASPPVSPTGPTDAFASCSTPAAQTGPSSPQSPRPPRELPNSGQLHPGVAARATGACS